MQPAARAASRLGRAAAALTLERGTRTARPATRGPRETSLCAVAKRTAAHGRFDRARAGADARRAPSPLPARRHGQATPPRWRCDCRLGGDPCVALVSCDRSPATPPGRHGAVVACCALAMPAQGPCAGDAEGKPPGPPPRSARTSLGTAPRPVRALDPHHSFAALAAPATATAAGHRDALPATSQSVGVLMTTVRRPAATVPHRLLARVGQLAGHVCPACAFSAVFALGSGNYSFASWAQFTHTHRFCTVTCPTPAHCRPAPAPAGRRRARPRARPGPAWGLRSSRPRCHCRPATARR